MSYRVIKKRKIHDSSVDPEIAKTAVKKKFIQKRKDRKGLNADAEDFRDILCNFEKNDDYSGNGMKIDKRSSCRSKSEKYQTLRGNKLDRNAHKWWCLRLGIQEHVASMLINQVQPLRSLSSTYLETEPISQKVFARANICSTDAPGACGTRRTSLQISSGAVARHYKPVLAGGTFTWGENFSFTSHPSEASSGRPPVGLHLLRPACLLSSPPVQRLHLVEPFRPVSLAVKDLILERSHLLTPSGNEVCLLSGEGLYPHRALRSGRAILRAVSSRIRIDGLEATPGATVSDVFASAHSSNSSSWNDGEAAVPENSGGKDAASLQTTDRSSGFRPAEQEREEECSDEESDSDQDSFQSFAHSKHRVDTEEEDEDRKRSVGLAYEYGMDPSDLETFEREHDEELGKKGSGVTEDEESDTEVLDGISQLAQREYLDAIGGSFEGGTGDVWSRALLASGDPSLSTSPPHRGSSESQSSVMSDGPAHTESEKHVRFRVVAGREDDRDEAETGPFVDDDIGSGGSGSASSLEDDTFPLEGMAQFQALESMLGRHMEGVTDAVLEMLLNFMEPYLEVLASSEEEEAEEMPPPEAPTSKKKRPVGDTEKSAFSSSRHLSLGYRAWVPRSQTFYRHERAVQQKKFVQARASKEQNQVTWEHVLGCVESQARDKQIETERVVKEHLLKRRRTAAADEDEEKDINSSETHGMNEAEKVNSSDDGEAPHVQEDEDDGGEEEEEEGSEDSEREEQESDFERNFAMESGRRLRSGSVQTRESPHQHGVPDSNEDSDEGDVVSSRGSSRSGSHESESSEEEEEMDDKDMVDFLNFQLGNELGDALLRATEIKVHPSLPSLHLTPAVVRRIQSRLLALFAVAS